MTRFALVRSACILSLALSPECSRTRQGPADASFGTDSTLDQALGAPVVRFRTDVVPVFERACAFASCHGAKSSSHGVYLGRGAPADVWAGLVGVRSERYRLVLVDPSATDASFLLRKVDGTLVGLPCAPDCGAPMPKKNSPLPLRDRLTIARWIAQGAKDD